MLTIYISSHGLKSRMHPQLGARLSNGFQQRLRDRQAGEENGLWRSNPLMNKIEVSKSVINIC